MKNITLVEWMVLIILVGLLLSITGDILSLERIGQFLLALIIYTAGYLHCHIRHDMKEDNDEKKDNPYE